MPVSMTLQPQRKPKNSKQLNAQLAKEFNFLKNIFSVISLPSQMTDNNEENEDYEMVTDTVQNNEDKELPKRARSIAELEEKLEKIKSLSKFNLKNKLVKKSLSSKLNKKLKKKERLKTRVKPSGDAVAVSTELHKKKPKQEKINVNAKPVFNTESKLVFSKFDFSNIGQIEKPLKAERDPKKILENLKHQEEKFKQLEENQEENKLKQIKEKIAWKNILQKAEGQKVKDDPTLLKKSIKKMEQKKKHSKKQWDTRIENVKQKKEDRQKKRTDNISKKKKEKKSKIIKAAVKRGRVVL